MTEMARLLTTPSQVAISHYALLILLSTGPMLIAIGALLPPRAGRPFLVAALIFLGLETALFFAPHPDIPRVGAHDSMATPTLQQEDEGILLETKAMFLGLFGIYAAVLFIPRILHRLESRLFSTALPLSFLVLYSAGTVFWLTTAAAEGP